MKRTFLLVLSFVLLVALFGVATTVASAQEPEGTVEAGTAEMSEPEKVELQWSAEPPTLTEEQLEQLEYWAAHTHLPGPARPEEDMAAAAKAAPASGTESALWGDGAMPDPMAPGSAKEYRKIAFGSVIPAGYSANVMESSVAEGGKYVFFTGNWFAARSSVGGTLASWNFVNPYADMGDFCCDQVTIYDEARDLHLWQRMGVPDANAENRFRLGVSTDGGNTFCFYDTRPKDVNPAWTNQWWDYNHIQLGADYVYLAWNMFDQFGFWTRTVMLRWPLDALQTCSGFSYNYFESTDWFTFVPVQGAYHTMYFASNFPPTSPWNQMRIWRWDEDSTSLNFWTKTLAPWNWSGYSCGVGANWLGRTDDRLLTGARYEIMNSDLKYRGRKVLAWWWDAAPDPQNGLPMSYIDGAAFFEDTMTQVGGAQGRPLVWSTETCFGYPSATPNKRADLAMIFHFGDGAKQKPSVAFTIADDYATAPPGWLYYRFRRSNALPSDNVWGDYNTLREFEPTQKAWVGASHFIRGSTDCSNCAEPVYIAFGRERDQVSYHRWKKK